MHVGGIEDRHHVPKAGHGPVVQAPHVVGHVDEPPCSLCPGGSRRRSEGPAAVETLLDQVVHRLGTSTAPKPDFQTKAEDGRDSVHDLNEQNHDALRSDFGKCP